MHGIPRVIRDILVFGILAAALFPACGEREAALPDTVDYQQHIRPILVQKCYRCHGPDSGSRYAGQDRI